MLSGFDDFEVGKMQKLGKRTVLHRLLRRMSISWEKARKV